MEKQSQKRIREYSFLVVLLVFFGLFSRVSASTLTEIHPLIDSVGNVTIPTAPTGVMYGFTVYKNTFASISNVLCSATLGGNNLMVMLNSNTMENCWANGAVATPDGDYWVKFSTSGSAYSPDYVTSYYWRANRTGGVWVSLSGGGMSTPVNTSYINGGLPSANINTSSTTVNFSADYFYSTSYPLLFTPTQIEPSFTRLDAPESTQFGSPCSITVKDTLETCTGTITLTSGGRYSIEWFMVDADANVSLTSTPYQFGVVNATGLPDLIPNTPTITYLTCSTGDFFCYMQNALTWAFSVPPASFDQFYTLRDTLKTKAPFGYITSLFSVLGNFSDTGTSTFTLQSFTALNDLIFTPLRTGLTWLLVLLFAFGLYERFKHVQL